MKSNQKGSVSAIVIALLVVIIIAGVGYIVWNNNKKDTSNSSNTSTGSSQNQGQSEIEKGISQLDNPSYTLSGLGLKVQDPQDKGINVKTEDVQSPYDDSVTTYYVLTPTEYRQKGFDNVCKEIGYVREVSASDAESYEGSSILVKNINGKYFTIGGTQGGCGDDVDGWDAYVRDYVRYIHDNLVSL